MSHLKEALQKEALKAGAESEYYSMLNPLNLVATPLGMLASTVTTTRTKSDQDEADKDKWKNILIPGYAGYNIGKRLGRLHNTQEGQELMMEPAYTDFGSKERFDKEGFMSSDWFLRRHFKQLSGREPSDKDMKELRKQLTERLPEVSLESPFLTRLGPAIVQGPAVGSATSNAQTHERVLQWEKNNPAKAKKLRKLVRKLSGEGLPKVANQLSNEESSEVHMNHLTEALIRKTADVKSHNEAAKHRRAFRNLSPEERVAVIQAPLHAYNVSMAALPGGGSAKPEASDAGGHAFGALLAAPFTMGYGGIKGGAVGAGIGGAAGASLGAALTWALMKNPETRDYITNSLIGGGLGAGAGVAVGAPVGAVREFGKSLDPGYLES